MTCQVFNFKNEIDKIYSFYFFVDFSTDSENPAIKLFKTGFGYPYMFILIIKYNS